MKNLIIFLSVFYAFTGCKTTISGLVEDDKGQFIKVEDATINLTNLQTGKESSMVTSISNEGKFEFPGGLEKGRYLLEALVPGYELYSVVLEVNESRKLKINLVPVEELDSVSFRAQSSFDSSRGQGGANLTPPKL